LGQNPSLDLTINMAVVTNPAGVKPAGPNQPAEVVIGPCGMKVQLSEMLERAPTPISTQEARNKLIDRLEDPDGGVRIRTLEALATYVMLLRKSATPDDKTVADEFADAIHKSRGDPAGPVRAWARYINAFINSGNQEDAINAMAGDADWLTRLLAAYGSPVLGAKASAIAQRLSSDRDPVVQQYAKALSRSLAAAATQPESASPPPLEPTVPPMEPTAPPAEQPAPPP
jgi:hypothetical protein